MNRLEDSPLFQSLNTLIDRLTEIWGSGKGEPSVGEILSAARAIEQIGKEGEGFLAEMQELLENSAVHEELAEIVAQCQEESPASPTVGELIARLGGWRDGFRDMLEEIEAARARREAQPTCQELQQNLKQLQTDVRNSQQLQDSLKLELRENLIDLAERLQPEADLQLLAGELERVRARFSSALRQPAAPPPQQPPLTSTAGASTQVTPDSLLDRLRWLQPHESNAVRTVREIQKQIKWNGNHEVVVNAVNQLEAQQVPSATWLKAVFVYSYLEVARGGSESLSGVLNSLESNCQKWLAGNWDVQAVAIRVCQSLEEFSGSYPSLLSKQELYDFFSRLQQARGNSAPLRLEIILSRLSLDLAELARFESSYSKHLKRALSHVERALVFNPTQQEAISLKQKIEQRMREAGIPNRTAEGDEKEEDEPRYPFPNQPAADVVPDSPDTGALQRRKEAEETLRQTVQRENPDSTRLIDLVINDYMNDPDVGPWLVYKLVRENELVTLQDSDRRSLVTQAKSVRREPSVEMFLAEVELEWGEDENYRREGGLEAAVERRLLEDMIREPAVAKLRNLHNRLATAKPWCAFVCFDCLWKQDADNLKVLWYRALCAKELKRKSDYFESAILCLQQVAGAATAVVATALQNMELHGLALAVAQLDSDSSPLGGELAQNCQMEPWEWPMVLQKAKEKFEIYQEDGNWVEAADLIVRALLASPTHWACCIAFLDIFTRPGHDGERWGNRAIEQALAVVRYLNRQPRFREQPELLVLEAELRFHAGTLDSPLLSETVRNECEELCRRALQNRVFEPAARLRKRLEPKPVALYLDAIVDKRYRIRDTSMPPGSFGQVYKAEITDENWEGPKIVALKQLRADAATSGQLQHFTELLEQEAKIALGLKHPHIVNTYEFIKKDLCLVMEFIEGETLWSKIQNRDYMPWESAARIGRQIADALRSAGEIVQREFGQPNFAHRDIHPRNIMVMGSNSNPHAKLLDFGLARLPGGLTTSVMLMGVNHGLIYRAPEYGKKMDFRGDMFALGVILYELLAGDGPYSSPVSGSQVPQSPRRLRGIKHDLEVPPQLEDILLKMVAFNKADRYKSYSDLIIDLDRQLVS